MAPRPQIQIRLMLYPSSQSPRVSLRVYRIRDLDVEEIERFVGPLDSDTSFMDLLLSLNDLYEREQQSYGAQEVLDLR